MGKKYLDTKEGSLEQSVLGVWQTAIDESDARVDGRTKQYKEHRAKLEAARQRREEKKLNKEEVELDESKGNEKSQGMFVVLEKGYKNKVIGQFKDKKKAIAMMKKSAGSKVIQIGKFATDDDKPVDIKVGDELSYTRVKLSTKVKEEVELDESQAEMYKLTAMAMKATPGSKAQKAIIKKLNVLRQKAGLQAIPESFDLQEQGPGLWANIHKKRKEGRPMRKKGEKGAPTTAQLKRAQGEEVSEDVELNEWGEVEEAAEYQGRKVTLNKPTRGDVKKSKVYVKNEKGNVVKVEFGDPNMEIKVDDPARRASFRARHNCENPGPKWKARYWSCKAW